MKAFERLSTYRGEGSFGGWLNRIAARLYIRRWRNESRLDWVADTLEDISGDMAPLAGHRMDLDKALQSLSAAERMCVSLCIGAGMTHQEAAIELRLPLGTVKSHVHRGLVKLRAHFEVAPQSREGSRVRA